MSPKRNIRSGSGAQIGDIRKIEEPSAGDDVCGQDGVCEPTDTFTRESKQNVCDPNDPNACA